jgi:hypothetical protein
LSSKARAKKEFSPRHAEMREATTHARHALNTCSTHALALASKYCQRRDHCSRRNDFLPYDMLFGTSHRLVPYDSQNSSRYCSSSPQALAPVRFGTWRITADACYWTIREATEQLSFSCLHLTHPPPTPTKPDNSVPIRRRRFVHVHTRQRACLKLLQTPVLCFKPVR